MSIIRTAKFIKSHPVTRHAPLAAFWRYLKWQIGSRLVPGPVMVPWVENTKFIARAGEAGVTGNIYCGLHDFWEMAYVLHALNSSDVFIDIGANSGTYTILACGARGAVGRCFEPVIPTFDRLVENLHLNGVEGRVVAHNCALGEVKGEAYVTSTGDCLNHVEIGSSGHAMQPVMIQTLDASVADCAPTMLKIDVEGFEWPVLIGGARVLASKELHSILIELNGSGARYGYHDEAIVRLLQSNGFFSVGYDPFTRTLSRLDALPAGGNVLFVREIDSCQRRVRNGTVVWCYGICL